MIKMMKTLWACGFFFGHLSHLLMTVFDSAAFAVDYYCVQKCDAGFDL